VTAIDELKPQPFGCEPDFIIDDGERLTIRNRYVKKNKNEVKKIYGQTSETT